MKLAEKFERLTLQSPAFAKVIEQVIDTHLKKSSDYAGAVDPFKNFKVSASFAGVGTGTAILLQMGNKIARLQTLLNSKETPNFESVEDTILDLAVYAMLYKAWLLIANGVVPDVCEAV